MSLMPNLKERSRDLELVDQPGDWSADLAGTFAEMAWTNRLFGGLGSLRRFLQPVLSLRNARILDVGTGTGETYRELGNWARDRGAEWRLVALDLSPRILALGDGLRTRSAPGPGKEPDLPGPDSLLGCAGNAVALPFPAKTFDAVICLQTLHHLSDAEAKSAIGEMVRVSRNLVVVSDLRRGAVPYWAARGLASAVWRNPLTRHDGPLSVRRGFTSRELKRLGDKGGATACQVHRHGLFRLVLAWATP